MKLTIISLLRLKKENLSVKDLANISFLSLIVLSITSGSIYIASIATVIGAPVGIVSASVSLAFSISTGIIKELLKTTRKKKKKHNKIVMLARSKLNSIESKISEALINNKISHEDFMTITNDEKITRTKRKH